jgi:hypothetical protein
MESKLLYCGAGLDLSIVFMFKDISIFYFVDSQPFSEYGSKIHLDSNGSNIFTRPNFISDLKKESIKYGFSILNEIKNMITFTHNFIKIYYYINTAVPEHFNRIPHDFNMILIKGFIPDAIVLNDFNIKTIFVHHGTSLLKSDSIVNFNDFTKINYCLHYSNYNIKKFIYIQKDMSFVCMDTWKELFDFHLKY